MNMKKKDSKILTRSRSAGTQKNLFIICHLARMDLMTKYYFLIEEIVIQNKRK
jgi:hypothetical protein